MNTNPKVSVIVPNYNHSPFLTARIESILQQTFQDFEIILMDDSSTDNSLAIIRKYEDHPQVSKVIINAKNSGNTFSQWNRGVSEARGEYIWIAESDDYAAPGFLAGIVPRLEGNENAGIVYCQSWSVNELDEIQRSWLGSTKDLDKDRWKKDYSASGIEEVESYLIYKNTIPNASAVVFKKEVYRRVGMADPDVAKCGDWFLWIKMLLDADVEYVAEHLNYFRKNSRGVIARASKSHYFYDNKMRRSLDNYLRQKNDRRFFNIATKNKELLRQGKIILFKSRCKAMFADTANTLTKSLRVRANRGS